MSTIHSLTLEVADTAAADRFCDALGVGHLVHTRESEVPPNGFGGFTLSLVVPQPADVDGLVDRALEAGGSSVKPVAKSLWGYGGVVRAPGGAVWTVASSSKKNTGPPTGTIEDFVLQLGVADVAVSRRFYEERGFTVAKSFGRRYVELDSGPVTVTLNKRAALAKAAGVPDEGAAPQGLVLAGDAGELTDPDGVRFA